MIGGGGGGAVAGGAPAAGGGAPGIPMTEVAKHNTKTDCWVVVDGQVLDVTSFLSEHPGGELAILTFAGKDATEEFNMILGCIHSSLAYEMALETVLFHAWYCLHARCTMRIHPPDVIGKYAPDSVIGNVGSGVAAAVGGAPKAGGAPARTGFTRTAGASRFQVVNPFVLEACVAQILSQEGQGRRALQPPGLGSPGWRVYQLARGLG